MIIRGIVKVKHAGRFRLRGEIVWEDNDKPAQELWYETEFEGADGFVCSSDPFLLAGYAMACCSKETRCRIEGIAVCPVLAGSMPLFARAYMHLYPGEKGPRLEAPGGYITTHPGVRSVAAAYVSGGVDALAMLHRNTATLSKDRPERFQEALCIFGLYGLDCPGGEPSPERVIAYDELRKRIRELTVSIGIRPIPAYTNVRSLIKDYELWSKFLFAPLHASVAHAFRDRWTEVWLASSGYWQAGNWCLESGVPSVFSSSALSFRHDFPLRSRLQRVRELIHWPAALRVCQPCHWVTVPEKGQINCGTCEKCVRTMLEFLICGKLDEASAFPYDDVTGEMIEKVWLGKNPSRMEFLEVLILHLEETGVRILSVPSAAGQGSFAWNSLAANCEC